MITGVKFSKLLGRKILGRFLTLGKSYENIQQSTNLELGNNNAIITVISQTPICVMLDVLTWPCC